jgi:outer membrane biosynthesis protein TonB
MIANNIKIQQQFIALAQSPLCISLLFHILILSSLFFSFSKNSTQEFTHLQMISLSNFDKISKSKVSSENGKENKVNHASKAGQGKKMKSSSSQQKSSQQNQLNSYVNAIASELDLRKSRFSMANAPENIKTTVIFKIKLDQNGNLVKFEFIKNSGYDFFDKIAEKILTYKSNFPAPPQEFAETSLEFSIPIIFDSLS